MTPERLAEIRALLAEPMKTYSVDAAQLHSCGRDLLAHIDTLAGECEGFPMSVAPKGHVLIYWPETIISSRTVLPAMYRVDVANGTPNRRPSRWWNLPAPPKPEVTP